MKGNFHVPFLEGLGPVTASGYSAMWLKSQVRFLEEGERVIALPYSALRRLLVYGRGRFS